MATAAASAAPAEHVARSANGPILVDLGKKSRKKVKKLRRDGEGALMDKVKTVLDELRANGTLKGEAQPVLIVVRERRKRKSAGFMFR